MGQRPKWQVVLSVSPGAEPWIIVRHQSGWFKLPLCASVEELVEGCRKEWTDSTRRQVRGEGTVRVPLSVFLARVEGWAATGDRPRAVRRERRSSPE